ncbi:MAG: cyclic nucleotide-binding domain-containing protein [Anaerolineae bacterium]|nr:cyclic nucleotide-binding domain-containing protein [Anaerolineae bacterium]
MFVADQLRQIDLFRDLNDDDFAAVFANLRRVHYPRGALLFRKGDPGDRLYLIQRGQVRIFVPDPQSGEEITITHYGPGQVFGELSPLDAQPRSAGASATEALDVWELHGADFLPLLRARPQIGLAMLQSLAWRLRHTTRTLEAHTPDRFEVGPIDRGEAFRRPAPEGLRSVFEKLERPSPPEEGQG